MEPIRVKPTVYGTFRRSSDRVFVLAESGGTRELPIRLSDGEAAAVESALAGSDLPLDPPYELALRVLRALGAGVQSAIVREVAGSYCVALRFAGSTQETVVDLAGGIALAAAEQAPVSVEAETFERNSWDPSDPAVHRRRDAQVRRRLQRLLRTGDVPQPVAPPVLPPDVQAGVEAVLERLAQTGVVRTAVLRHDDGGHQAWSGLGDEAMLALHAVASVREDDELAELTTTGAYPSAHVKGGIRFGSVAGSWQLEAGLLEEWPPSRLEEEFEPRFAEAQNELEALLMPR